MTLIVTVSMLKSMNSIKQYLEDPKMLLVDSD